MRDRETYFARLKRSFIANRADARLAADRADGLGKLLATYKQRLAQQQRWETALLRGMMGTLDQPTRAQVLEAAKRHGYLKRDESEDNDA